LSASEDEDDVDYVFLGTPLEHEKESDARSGRRKRADPAVTRHKAVWDQVATDEEGRRRFHGAFTGGFSAGYFNTVGTPQGFTPQTFVSSKGKRAAVDDRTREQQVEDFLDEDELEERKRRRLDSTRDYDTFGGRAAEEAQELAQFELRKKGGASAIPGGPLLMDAMIKPVSDSIGIRMLLALGWRRGKGVGRRSRVDRPATQAEVARATDDPGALAKHLESVANTPIYVKQPKDNTFGLGYDPYRRAAEFSERRKKKGVEGSRGDSRMGLGGIGFGVFDEDDELRVDDVYGDSKGDYNFEIVEEEEEKQEEWSQGPSASGFGKGHRLSSEETGGVEGFEHGGRLENRKDFKWFRPPVVPGDFKGLHVIKGSKKGEGGTGKTPPPKAEPPKDPGVMKTIHSLAAYVARNGPQFEALAKERNAFNSKFNFLQGGVGCAYYKWKLHEEKEKAAKVAKSNKPAAPKVPARPSVASYIANPNISSQVNAPKKEFLMPQAQVAGLHYPAAPAETEPKAVDRDLVPVRSEQLWQPEYLLCKRFGVKDPHKGQVISTSQRVAEFQQPVVAQQAGMHREVSSLVVPEADQAGAGKGDKQEYVEKPFEVFKAIFSDSEEDPKALADSFLASL